MAGAGAEVVRSLLTSQASPSFEILQPSIVFRIFFLIIEFTVIFSGTLSGVFGALCARQDSKGTFKGRYDDQDIDSVHGSSHLLFDSSGRYRCARWQLYRNTVFQQQDSNRKLLGRMSNWAGCPLYR
jgi:hypothetical protein